MPDSRLAISHAGRGCRSRVAEWQSSGYGISCKQLNLVCVVMWFIDQGTTFYRFPCLRAYLVGDRDESLDVCGYYPDHGCINIVLLFDMYPSFMFYSRVMNLQCFMKLVTLLDFSVEVFDKNFYNFFFVFQVTFRYLKISVLL